MSKKRWQLFPKQPEIASKLAEKLNSSTYLAQILLNRQINSLTQAESFINPNLNLKENMAVAELEKASQIIEECQNKKKKIFIYGDYDADGVTSVTLLYNFLFQENPNISFYIPNRFSDGYGLNQKIINSIIASNIDLLITVDCGISNFLEIANLKAQSQTQVIIMDHHSLPDQIPAADVVLNPKSLEPQNPVYHLSAVGVVYKFLEFYCNYLQKTYDLQNDLDLVAIGTVADVVFLIGTNRTLVKNGLEVLAKRHRLGIRALLEVIRFNKPEISARDVGFMIAPYINASGRLESAKIAVDLLLSKDWDTAVRHASKLRILNEQRQQLGIFMLKDAKNTLDKKELTDYNILVLSGSDWHSGIIGIIASQLAQEFYRPVVLISSNNEIARGSARSFANINIYELLKSCQEYFIEFGGHTQAAGFSIKNEKIAEFKEKILGLSKTNISKNDLIPVIDIDCEIFPSDINLKLINELSALAPYGQNNPVPVFYSQDLLPIDFKTVGDGSHLKVTFSEKSGKYVFDAIGFGLSSKLNLLYNKKVELVFNLELNNWSGQTMPQIKIVDIK